MNNTINLNYLTRLSGALSGNAVLQRPAARDGDFLAMAARLKAEQSGSVPSTSQRDDLSLEAYKQSIWEKISLLPMSASSQMQSISVQISDAGFEAMRSDPDYEAWVLDTLARDFRFQNPWTASCGGGYVVHHFGATKEAYRGESWYPGYMGGQGASLFAEKSKESFWEQRMERHKKYMELQQEAAARRRMLQKLGLNGSSVSAAELLMCLM